MESFLQAAFSEQYLVFTILLLTGSAELLIIFFIYQYRQRIIEQGQETTGRVVDVVSKRGSKGETLYYPVFRFRTYMNEEITQQSKISSGPSTYPLGSEVMIIYNVEKPKQFIIRDDKRFRLFNYVLGGMGLLFFLVGLYGLLPLTRTF